jgi:hypothetical protein
LPRLRSSDLQFCANPTCDAVYFADGHPSFGTTDIGVPVWQKQAPGARLLCYCFGENETDMQRELDVHGRTSAVLRVRQRVADRECACEVRNPRGVCCLGDLAAAVKRLTDP